MYEEVQKHFNSDLQSYIVTTRYFEGHLAASQLSEEDRRKVIDGWEMCDKQEPDFMDRWRSAQQRRKGRPKNTTRHLSPYSSSRDANEQHGDTAEKATLMPRPRTAISSETLHSSISTPEANADASNHPPFPARPSSSIDNPQDGSHQNPVSHEDEEDEMIRRAAALSLESENKRVADLEAARREEEIVMEYIKKVSLAEAELRANVMAGKQAEKAEDSEDEWN